MRRHFSIPCAGEYLVGTIDAATGSVGLLIVSGGNEVRSGAFSGQAKLARAISQAGYPVLRFDRRGVGDSSGENRGFRDSATDILAARDALREAFPGIKRIVAYGNCDAASALMLAGGIQADALVLANPWTFDEESQDGHSPASIRSRYAAKLAKPGEILRLLKGEVDLRKLAKGLARAAGTEESPARLLTELRRGVEDFHGKSLFLVSGRDRTGQAFARGWGDDPRIRQCEAADHGFSDAESFAWLQQQLLAVLEEQACQLDMR